MLDLGVEEGEFRNVANMHKEQLYKLINFNKDISIK